MEVDRSKFVEALAEEMRAAGVPDAEGIAERIGDRYVELLEEKARELWLGVSPLTPTGVLRIGNDPTIENDWIRRRFLEEGPSWRSVLRSGELVTDEMRADVCYPNHRVGGRE